MNDSQTNSTLQQLKDGGQAFPAYRGFDAKPPHVPGMTLRDYFAAKVIGGYLSIDAEPTSCREDQCETIKSQVSSIVEMAYAVADAMLKARGAQ